MADIHNLDDYRPHRGGMAGCLACGEVFVTYYPASEDMQWKECPACEKKAVQWMDMELPEGNWEE